MKNKTIIVLVSVIIVLIVVAVGLSTKQQQDVEDTIAGGVFLDRLSAQVNDVAKLTVQYNGETATVYKKDDAWVILEKSNYPADFTQVKKLVLALSDLTLVEPKTRSPEKYSLIGVQDITDDGSNKLVSLFDASGKPLAQVILGKLKGNSIYVRRVGEPQAWLVKGRIDTPAVNSGWLDRQIADIKSTNIQEVEIKHKGKEAIKAIKTAKEDNEFTLAKKPKDKELNSASAVSTLATNLQGLSLTELHKSSDLELGKAEKVLSHYKTFDGLTVDVTLYSTEDKHYISLSSSVSDNATDDTKARSEKLNARWADWLYQIPPFKADSFRKKMSDVLK